MLAIERRGFAANLGAGRKAPCRVATTANVTLSGTQTIDGVAVVADDRVLVKNQTNTRQNAVYVCKTGDWELASDFNQRGDVVKGSLVFVTEGTANGLKDWYVTTSGRPWPGREAIAFAQISPLVGVSGAAWAGNRAFDLTADTNTAAVKTANTAAIQAAIDHAYAEGLQTVNITAGDFYCDPGIYLDAPGNLRSSLTTPTIFSFSMNLKGAGGLYNHNNHGTQLRFTDNSTTALIVGTGQGMRVSDLSIIGPTGATSREALSANGIGIGLAGGSAGLSRCLLDNVGVSNFRKGYVTGFNANVLCDSVTLFKCVAFDCHTGIHFKQTQNYVNSMIACDFGGNKIHVLSDVAKAVNVFGGNYSTADADRNAFTIGSVSGLTTFSDSTQLDGLSFTNATFTATLSSPDQPMRDGSYDRFVINNTAFGPIPLLLTNFNTSTNVATFKFHAGWLLNGTYDLTGSLGTLLAAQLATATTLYACETITTFSGFCFNVDGIHVECPGAYHRLYYHASGFGGDNASHFNRVTFNADISQDDFHGGTAANEAAFLCQQSFPFIQFNNVNGRVSLSNIVNVRTDNPVIIEPWGNDEAVHRLAVTNCDLRPVVRPPSPSGALYGGSSSNRRTLETGWGTWDDWPFPPKASDNSNALYARERLVGIPFEGHFPAPWAQLTIHADQLSDIQDGLGSVGSYLPLFGRRPYQVVGTAATAGGVSAARWVESDHLYFSYGQNLTIDWDYVGGTNVLLLTDTTRMFAGLVITLDNGGGDVSYIVTGVHPALGFVTVVRTNGGVLAGTVGTDYSGATVKQASYSLSYVGTLPASKFTTNTTSGAATAASGDLTGANFVNIKLTAVGSTNYTTRTAAQMFSDIPGCYSGYKYMLAVSNVSTGDTVLAAGSNVTVKSTGNIPSNAVRMFEVRFTSTAAVTFDGQTSTST